MRIENIKEVESEIERFLKRLKEFKKSDSNKHLFEKNPKHSWIRGDKTSGALKKSVFRLNKVFI